MLRHETGQLRQSGGRDRMELKRERRWRHGAATLHQETSESEAEGTRMAGERPRGVIADACFGRAKPPKTLWAMTRQLASASTCGCRQLDAEFCDDREQCRSKSYNGAPRRMKMKIGATHSPFPMMPQPATRPQPAKLRHPSLCVEGGCGLQVWNRFRLRKEQRRLQGIIHGKRCGNHGEHKFEDARRANKTKKDRFASRETRL
jgi:hypothetical protein